MTTAVKFSVDGDGTGWIVFNDPELRVNVLNPSTLAQLRVALDTLAASAARAIVITSAKERVFIAGADLHWLASLPDASAAAEVSRKGQRLFEAIATLPVPAVCAIAGACAGGGLELALACQGRIATDAPATRIGLPETGIGLIPAWGGSVRLPRLIGVPAAIDHILKAELVSAPEALALGLVDEVVSPAGLATRAAELAQELARTGAPLRLAPQEPPAGLLAGLRAKLSAEAEPQVARLAAIDVVERTGRMHLRPALEIEAETFGRIATAPASRALIEDFFRRRP